MEQVVNALCCVVVKAMPSHAGVHGQKPTCDLGTSRPFGQPLTRWTRCCLTYDSTVFDCLIHCLASDGAPQRILNTRD
jgi:hypothetical protein